MRASPEKEVQRRKDEEANATGDLQGLYAKLNEAEAAFNDLAIRDVLIELGDYFLAKEDIERSLNNFLLAYDKSQTVDIKLDITLKLMLIGFKTRDLELLKKQVETAKKMFEEGGDWERKNRFKAYEAVYLMMARQFKAAALNFLEILATFNAPELFTYQEFVKYTVIMSLVSLDRATIRSKVVHAPEILSVIRELPAVRQFMDALFKCQYKLHFQAFVQVFDIVSQDFYLGGHSRYWSREMRVVTYSQFLESYRSVTLDSMAASFGVGVEFIDRELCEFISIGRLACKIDRVTGVVESARPDSRNASYQALMKNGDFLLNRLQKLARVMDV
jgi:26S proteasome regulatory subunit N7